MAFDFRVDVTGFDGLLDRIKTLSDDFQAKAVRKAARKAMRIARDQARRNAKTIDDPNSTEEIWKNIATRESARGGRRVGGIVMRVGAMGGARRYKGKKLTNTGLPGGDTRHWRHQEFGTRHHRAQIFMLPALMNNAQRISDRLANELVKELDKHFVGPLPP